MPKKSMLDEMRREAEEMFGDEDMEDEDDEERDYEDKDEDDEGNGDEESKEGLKKRKRQDETDTAQDEEDDFVC